MISHMVMENNKDMGSNPSDGKKFYKGRNFQLTLNEPEKWNDLRLYVTSLAAMQYIIACKEKAPTTGHEHIHCYVQFKNPTKLVISKLQGAHVENCKGSAQQNIAYIKGEDKEEPGEIIFEDGTPLKKGKSIADIKAMSRRHASTLTGVSKRPFITRLMVG